MTGITLTSYFIITLLHLSFKQDLDATDRGSGGLGSTGGFGSATTVLPVVPVAVITPIAANGEPSAMSA